MYRLTFVFLCIMHCMLLLLMNEFGVVRVYSNIVAPLLPMVSYSSFLNVEAHTLTGTLSPKYK